MKHLALFIASLVMAISVWADNSGIVSRESGYTVSETVDRLEAILRNKGITVFARIDHSGEAEKLGLKMLPTKLLIFGNPKAGTPLMNAAPSIALDLPLKALISEDERGKVWVSYNSPAYLKQRHGLTDESLKPLSAIESLIAEALK